MNQKLKRLISKLYSKMFKKEINHVCDGYPYECGKNCSKGGLWCEYVEVK